MTVLGRLVVDRVGQVKLLDDDTGPHIKVVANDFDKLIAGLVASSVGLNEQAEGLGDTDGVGKLDQATAGELGTDKGFGDPTSKVGS